MEKSTRHRQPFVHKRQGSGSNDTTTLSEVRKDLTSTTSNTPATIASSKRTETTDTKVASKVESSSSSAAAPSSSATSTEKVLTLQSKSSASASVQTPSTSALPVPIESSNTLNAAPVPIANPTTSTAPQLIAAPSPSAPPLSPSASPATPPPASSPPNDPPPAPTAAVIVPPPSPSEAPPSGILVDSSMRTAQTSSISAPSFVSFSSIQVTQDGPATALLQQTDSALAITTGIPGNGNGPQGSLAAATTSGLGISATGIPINGQSNDLNNGTISSSSQPSSSPAIIGATIGSIAGFVVLAMIGIWLIRRRYRNTTVIMGPFSRRSSKEREPLSPPPMLEYFKPDVKAMMGGGGGRYSAEYSSRSSSPCSSPPAYRHSRSFTVPSIAPAIPARSTARPLIDVSQTSQPTNNSLPISQPSEPVISMDNSFMGTISTYFNDGDRNHESEPMPTNPHHAKHISSSTGSQYSVSPYTSYIAPDHPPLPAMPNTISNPATNSVQRNFSTNVAPPITNTNLVSTQTPTLPAHTLSTWREPSTPAGVLLSTSRYASMGQWRDSVWSTTAPTPLFQPSSSNSSGVATPNPFFSQAPPQIPSRPVSAAHRASRSMGDAVIDWRTEPDYTHTTTTRSTSTSSGSSGGATNPDRNRSVVSGYDLSRRSSGALTSPPPLISLGPDSQLHGSEQTTATFIPPRNSLRAWPLQ